MVKRWEPQSEGESDEVWMAATDGGNWVRYGEYEELQQKLDYCLNQLSELISTLD